ncbi:hypothetical protein [Streptomyces sp. NPDC002067]
MRESEEKKEHQAWEDGAGQALLGAGILEVFRGAGAVGSGVESEALSEFLGALQWVADEVSARSEAVRSPAAAPPESPHLTLLSAERGNLNAGTVRGGQHVTGTVRSLAERTPRRRGGRSRGTRDDR